LSSVQTSELVARTLDGQHASGTPTQDREDSSTDMEATQGEFDFFAIPTDSLLNLA